MLLAVTAADGQMKIVKNVVVPNQTIANAKNTLTSLLTGNSNKLTGRRILMTKAADGTTRVIAGATNVLGKGTQNSQQSLIKVQSGTPGQQVQIQSQGQLFCVVLVLHFIFTFLVLDICNGNESFGYIRL